MLTVQDVMTTPVRTVGPETPLKDVARLLIEQRISGIPVVDADGRVLGVVSEADFLVKEQGPDAIGHRRLARFLGESGETRDRIAKLGAATAGEGMTSPAVTIEPARRTSEAAALMTERRINRLPVVHGGRLVGIVTRADLVRAYVRTDDELARSIREDVLLRVLWLDPSVFEVAVRDGVASIHGQVERRSMAEMVERAVTMVPGIIDVRSDVSWSFDDSKVEPPVLEAVFPFSPR